jgi:hypothetical protein
LVNTESVSGGPGNAPGVLWKALEGPGRFQNIFEPLKGSKVALVGCPLGWFKRWQPLGPNGPYRCAPPSLLGGQGSGRLGLGGYLLGGSPSHGALALGGAAPPPRLHPPSHL